uniref:Uncharacterized protein n=1 Tax=Sinocyclocheilus anshuiensis TaxID=1608454 RepID=A0A671MU89_9TELE
MCILLCSLFFAIPKQDEDAEAAELDLGTKIKTPKDVMLEELSLMKNKGSKMFKMRQDLMHSPPKTMTDSYLQENGIIFALSPIVLCAVFFGNPSLHVVIS